jgi:hypothetical protein
MYKYSPTRNAILLGAQTPRGFFLAGVPKDVEQVGTYFRSPNGGAWKENEVLPMYNPTWQQAIAKVKDSVADYSIIYFSGHGYTNLQGELMICFPNGDVPVRYLFNDSPPTINNSRCL